MDDLVLQDHEELPKSGAERRGALALLAGGAFLAGAVDRASAQVSASVDTVPLQVALNIQYLTTNFLQTAVYGPDRWLPPEHIRAGETLDAPGVPATSAKQISYSSSERDIQPRFQEIGDSHWFRTLMLRSLLRADAQAQTLIDYSVPVWTNLFRIAGAIGPNDTFDPYASAINCMVATETLLSIPATVYPGLVARMTNPIATAAVMALASAAAQDLSTIRSIIYDRGQTRPELLTMVDRMAAWRDSIDGTSVTDRGLSAISAAGGTASRLALTDANGLQLVRTPEQGLNVAFMNAASVTRGGFFPNGVNGSVTRSAAN